MAGRTDKLSRVSRNFGMREGRTATMKHIHFYARLQLLFFSHPELDATLAPIPCPRGRELERSLEEALHRTDAEHERGTAVQEELSRLREDMEKSEQEWKRFALRSSRFRFTLKAAHVFG